MNPLNLTILVNNFILRGFEEGPGMVAGGSSNSKEGLETAQCNNCAVHCSALQWC